MHTVQNITYFCSVAILALGIVLNCCLIQLDHWHRTIVSPRNVLCTLWPMSRLLAAGEDDDDVAYQNVLNKAYADHKTPLGFTDFIIECPSRPTCKCWCGCGRRPSRLVSCLVCKSKVGPGCCLCTGDICHQCTSNPQEVYDSKDVTSTKTQSLADVLELQEFDNQIHRYLSPATGRLEDWFARWKQDTTSQEVPVNSPFSSSCARESVAGSMSRVADTLTSSSVSRNNLPESSVSELGPKAGKCCSHCGFLNERFLKAFCRYFKWPQTGLCGPETDEQHAIMNSGSDCRRVVFRKRARSY